LTNENALIKLSIRDNGLGFDVLQTSKGNGLLNMKEPRGRNESAIENRIRKGQWRPTLNLHLKHENIEGHYF
jgi:signal transduction histidine kinase